MQETMEDTTTRWRQPTTIHELRWDWVEDDVLVRQQLGKEIIWNSNGWVIVAYLYRDLNRKLGEYKPPRVALVKYRRRQGILKRTGQAFTLNAPQSFVASCVLKQWMCQSEDDDTSAVASEGEVSVDTASEAEASEATESTAASPAASEVSASSPSS